MWVKLFHMPQRQCHIITTVSQFKSDIHQIQNYSTAVHHREHKIFTGSFKKIISSVCHHSLFFMGNPIVLQGMEPLMTPHSGFLGLWVTIIGSMRCMFMQSVSHICKDLIIVTTIITLYRRETIKVALGVRIRKHFSQPSVENHRLRHIALFINIYGLDPWPLVVMFGLILFLFLCAIIILIVRNLFICKEMDHQ